MTINLNLNQDEQQVFLQLIDSALKTHGAAALDVAAHFTRKLEQARAAASVNRNEAGAMTAPAAQTQEN